MKNNKNNGWDTVKRDAAALVQDIRAELLRMTAEHYKNKSTKALNKANQYRTKAQRNKTPRVYTYGMQGIRRV